MDQDTCQAVRMRERLGQGNGLGAALPGLIWIAQKPESHRQRPKTAQPGISLVQQVMGVVLLRVVDGDALLQVPPSRAELTQPEERIAQSVVATQEERRIVLLLGQNHALFPT